MIFAIGITGLVVMVLTMFDVVFAWTCRHCQSEKRSLFCKCPECGKGLIR